MKNNKSFIKTFILSCLLFFQANYGHAQTSSEGLKIYLYNKVYKNISAFNIINAQYKFNGAVNDSPFYSTQSFFYDAFLPDLNYKLQINLKKTSLSYPLDDYDIYEVQLDGMKFENKAEKIVVMRSGLNIGKRYLVALKKTTQDIKFVSGRFFLSAITTDFAIDKKNPETFVKYLQLRTYSESIEQIQYKKKRGDKLIYRAFSSDLNKSVKIVVDLRKIEYPVIKVMND